MFGGMGGGRSSFRIFRIGLLVVFLVFAATLHDHGTAYNVLHVVYLVLAIGLLIGSVVMSRRSSGGSGRNRQGRGGRFGNQGGPSGGGSFGSPPPPAHPVEQPDPEA